METKTKTDRKRKKPILSLSRAVSVSAGETRGGGCWAGVLLCMWQCFGSGLDPDSIGSADPEPGRLKVAQNRKNFRNFMFEESECPL